MMGLKAYPEANQERSTHTLYVARVVSVWPRGWNCSRCIWLNVDEFGLKVDTLNQFMRNVKV